MKGGGNLYVPTPEDKAKFAEAATPVYDWFGKNVKDGEKWLGLLRDSANKAEAAIEGDYADIK